MLQCEGCEFFEKGPEGRITLRCNPFSTIKEEACLQKWQLLKLDTMVQAYVTTVKFYQRLAPLQEKMFRHLERELEDLDEADFWKRTDDELDDDQDDTDGQQGIGL